MNFFTIIVSFLVYFASVGLCKYNIQDGQLLVQNTDGMTTANYLFPSKNARENPISLSTGDSLGISFTISPAEPKPSQVALLIGDVQVPVSVRKAGVVKHHISTDKELSTLAKTVENLNDVSIIIGHPEQGKLQQELVKFEFDEKLQEAITNYEKQYKESLPAQWQLDRYGLRDAISWSFESEPSGANPTISLVCTIIVLVVPWIVLTSFISQLPSSIFSLNVSVSIFVFLAVLIAFEGLIFIYWTSLRLLQVLLPTGIMSVIAFATGRNALIDVKAKRQ